MTNPIRLAILALAALSAAHAQMPAQRASQPPASSIPALFLSDIHYDSLRDPSLAPRLNAAPASEWPRILATPPPPTLQADYDDLQKACPTRGLDPDETLWQSTLQALRAQAGAAAPHPARFAILSGDILPHNFPCRYTHLFPNATHADFLNFAENTLRYAVTSLHGALPGIPLYIALGNNDSGCMGNSLDPANDFLALTAKVVAETLPRADRRTMLRDFAAGGYYSTLMAAPMSSRGHRTRLLVVDDLFFITEFSTCEKKKDYAEETAQVAWLNAQLTLARRRHEDVWLLGHIPPGVTLYTTFLQKRNICTGTAPAMAMESEALAAALAANADIVRLAIFAHTHSDAFALLTPTLGEPGPAPPRLGPGVPVKVVASVSAINGNNPSFTLASINPRTATLTDYTVIQSSNLTGRDATWTPFYTYSQDYHEPDFSPRSLANLIADFRSDPAAALPASRAYLEHHYSTSGTPTSLRDFWPVYVCAMDHDTGKSFAACACATGAVPAFPPTPPTPPASPAATIP